MWWEEKIFKSEVDSLRRGGREGGITDSDPPVLRCNKVRSSKGLVTYLSQSGHSQNDGWKGKFSTGRAALERGV